LVTDAKAGDSGAYLAQAVGAHYGKPGRLFTAAFDEGLAAILVSADGSTQVLLPEASARRAG
jgi:hypothetical protein